MCGENQLADGDFGAFSNERRISVTWQDIDVGLLDEMLEAQRELEEALVEARQAGAGPKQEISRCWSQRRSGKERSAAGP